MPHNKLVNTPYFTSCMDIINIYEGGVDYV